MKVLETPGHTPGSVCLYLEKEGILFSGDTLFCMGYGRTDLPGGNTAQLIASLEHLFSLPPATRVLPGHGEFTTIGEERR
jgi:glyoxylase-like metal-dependent hydrolase (beta-lactamase superfamily II)